jgi:UDP-GlcNAc:undecaprenyl-phosphate GlcNAc-1-phosphate transferase
VINLLGLAAAFVTAWLAAVALTPVIARVAMRLGAMDQPDGRRKSQPHPVPRGGGVAVTLAAILATVLAVLLFPPSGEHASTWLVRGLLPATGVLLVVGIIDDALTLTGIYKLIGQVLAVTVLVAAGAQFDQVSLFGLLIPLGDLKIPFTIFFCLGVINAFNLIDGADGLASSIGAIVCTTLGAITATRGGEIAAMACFAVAGSLVGFLRYNVPPARIYLGDTGSMLMGLVVAAVAIDCSIKQEAAFVLSVPIAICAIPILDAAAALVRRVTTGQSVFAADRGHLHHALMLRGWSVGKTVAFISSLTALTSAGALVSYFTGNDIYALAITAGVFVTLATARVFGHAEAALVASRSRSLLRGLVQRTVRRPATETESAVQLQGTRKWQRVWSTLREAAPLYNVAGLTLQVNIPRLHESFYATWKRADVAHVDDAWRMTIPLMYERQLIGKLSLQGSTCGDQAVLDMQQLLEYLEPLHGEIAQIAAGDAYAVPQPLMAEAVPSVG